jgi:hypothetical protein
MMQLRNTGTYLYVKIILKIGVHYIVQYIMKQSNIFSERSKKHFRNIAN